MPVRSTSSVSPSYVPRLAADLEAQLPALDGVPLEMDLLTRLDRPAFVLDFTVG